MGFVDEVLRDIWRARGQTSAELEEMFGHGNWCKAMRHVSFHGGGPDDPVDESLRTAWRNRLEREGKLRPRPDCW